MINRQFYEAPEAEFLDVKFEKNILSDPGTTDGSGFSESATVTDHSNSGVWSWME